MLSRHQRHCGTPFQIHVVPFRNVHADSLIPAGDQIVIPLFNAQRAGFDGTAVIVHEKPLRVSGFRQMPLTVQKGMTCGDFMLHISPSAAGPGGHVSKRFYSKDNKFSPI